MAIINVVKWNASPDEFVWKYPSDKLTTATRLIVSVSQEAVVVLGGELSGPFGPGTHILDTKNIPILRHLVNVPFGGDTPYSAEVWFVQKTTPLNLLWGTQDPVPLLDPKFNVPVPVRCFGQFGVTVADSVRFLRKLVGTYDTFNTAMLCDHFKGMVQTKVKALVAAEISRSGCSVFEINQNLEALSAALAREIGAAFAEFGVDLVNFYVQSVNFPQDDPAIAALRQSLTKRADMSILGYNYTQERSFDVLQGAAQNEGTAGAIAGAGLGLGLGAAVGGAISPSVTQTVSGVLDTSAPRITCPGCGTQSSAETKFCPECGKALRVVCCGKPLPPGAKFCPECGRDLQKNGD
ncbi:MAG: SPFH domain-containing protein [Lentisphaeria bacterium]|nr:SPFH domain-containing protein [Lentisphaeria bacterium]